MSEVLLKQDGAQRAGLVSSGLLAGHAARVFVAGGAILLVGALIDLFVLWVLQRQATIQWEFVALGSTTNSYPVLVLSAALFYGALAFGGSESLARYRLAAMYVIALGLLGLSVAFLVGTNYLAVRRGARVTPEVAPMIQSLVVKSGGVSVLFGLVLLVVGLLGLRRPRRGMR